MVIELIKLIIYFYLLLLLVVKLVGVFVFICFVCVPTNYKKKDINKDDTSFTLDDMLYNNLILDLSKSNTICL